MSMSAAPVSSDLPAPDDVQGVKLEAAPQESDAFKTALSTTPPSSPPIYQSTMASQSRDMPPPTAPASKTRKRSRGESADVAIHVPDSSAIVIDVDDPFSTQDQQRDTTTDFTAAKMPNAQNQHQAQSLQRAPASAQSADVTHRQRIAVKSEKSSHQFKQPSQQEILREDEEPSSDITTTSNDPGLPEERIEDFDWSEMEGRYHRKLQEVQKKEQDNFSELDDLVKFFGIWAEMGARKEDDRGFKRLKTQMTYVQHEEGELEKKRLHYIRVVDAFKSALELLAN